MRPSSRAIRAQTRTYQHVLAQAVHAAYTYVMSKAPLTEWNSKEVMMRRAAYLLIGLAIGMFMLGALQMARQSHLRSLEQAAVGASGQNGPPPITSTTPVAPTTPAQGQPPSAATSSAPPAL